MNHFGRFSLGVSLLGLVALGCGSGAGTPGTGSGGNASSGGATGIGGAGVGGAAASGGKTGSGGGSSGGGASGGQTSQSGGAENAGSGGVSGDGGAKPTGGAGGGSGGGAAIMGKFTVEKHLASEMAQDAPTTVGIVTWSVEGGTPTDAKIEFGLTTDYGMSAPVDLAEADFRTLLLGMKPAKTYHFRIVATVGGQVLTSEDFTIETGAAPTTVSISKFDIVAADKREPGFIVSSYWSGNQKGMVFILDQDGDIVWWRNSGISGGVAKAAMSMDGKDMWMISANNMGEPLRRVGMDGMNAKTYTAVGSHDIQPVSGDKMIFIEYGETDCDSTFEINKAGETKEVLELEGFTPKGACHGNSIAYNKTNNMYVMSSLDVDVFVYSAASTPGTTENTTRLTTKAGAISTWGGIQHGVQLLKNNNVIIFANKEGGAMGPSTAIEFSLESGMEVWRYESTQYTANLGDVQRLPGGNTLVTYSNAGVIHEVTAGKEKVLEITAQKNLGYATWRKSLYGDSDDSLQ